MFTGPQAQIKASAAAAGTTAERIENGVGRARSRTPNAHTAGVLHPRWNEPPRSQGNPRWGLDDTVGGRWPRGKLVRLPHGSHIHRLFGPGIPQSRGSKSEIAWYDKG